MNNCFRMRVCLLLMFIMAFSLLSTEMTCFAENPQNDIKEFIYTEVLPGQTVKVARTLYGNNPCFKTTELEQDGRYSYLVEPIDEVSAESFLFFSVKPQYILFCYDKTKGIIKSVDAVCFLEGVFESDVTDIHNELIGTISAYGKLVEKEIEDTDEQYTFSIDIDEGVYSLTVNTHWGVENSEDPDAIPSAILFEITLDENNIATSGAPASTPSSGAPTPGQTNALKSAKNYLSLLPFSYSGLIRQLMIGDGYTEEEATYAADNCGADWNEQAVRSAQNYLSLMSFSRSGLIQQLTVGDGYTKEQATYAADQLGL